MAVSTLDPKTALIVIDLQNGIVSLPTVHPIAGVVKHARAFNVTLAVDAMTDTNPDAHLNSITRIFPRLGETGTSQEIIDLLESTRS